MNEKGLTMLSTLGVILLGVVAPLLGWFLGGKELEGNAKEIIRSMLNFEITLIIASLLSIIPFVGLIVGLVIFIGNIVVGIMAFSAYNKGTPFKAPGFEFVK